MWGMLRKCAWTLVLAGASLAPAWAAGPILVVGSSSNPFSAYYREILRAEGITTFDYVNISSVGSGTLTPYEVVILGETPLTSGQVTTFTNWVNAGGRLIAMRPDSQLASLLGLIPASGTLSNAYLAVDASAPPGAGIVSETIQFHGAADRYTLGSAAAVATLYLNATTPTANPAVTLRTVGTNGGRAAAFTYDLAKSVVYTRQGNPAWAGQERDGVAPRRSDDLFFGAASSDPQPDWLDRGKIAIPQADEQQRLLVNLILYMNQGRTPVPRFWYLPFGKKAVIVMTGDDHGNGGTVGRFDDFIQRSPSGCSLNNWECVRGTSYIYTNTPLSNSQAAAYNSQGFEIGVHFNTGCADFTSSSLESTFVSDLQSWSAKYTSVPSPQTNRTHCIVWSDWVTHAEVELAHGIRLDTNYYHWPDFWLQTNGFMTGSGIPMRFARLDGSTVDVYQAATQMTDESGQSYPAAAITLMDNALGPQGYYGVFTANMHTDSSTGDTQVAAGQIVAAAQARGVPVIAARQLLSWLDAREASAFNSVSWNGSALTFAIAPGSGANGLQALLPVSSGSGGLTALTRNGNSVSYSLQTIKGVAYAVFTAASGNYQATYSSSGISVSVSPSAVTLGQSQSQQFTATVTGTGNTSVQWSYSPTLGTLTSGGLYTAPAGGTGTVVVTATSVADPSKSGSAPVTLASSAPPVISSVNAAGTGTGTATVTWVTDRPADSRIDYGTSPDSLTLSATNSTLVTGHSLTLSGLTTGTRYYYRVASADSAGLSATWPPLSGAPASFVAQSTVSIWSPSIVPALVDSNDGDALELGLKFRSDVAGQVLGVRFYKAAANTGTHTGSLWTTGGSRLATLTFSAETASGWQTAYFSAPVAILANTTYIVSYYAPAGRYSANVGAFESAGTNNPPLHALANGVDGPNGVYRYGTGGGFPDSTYNSTNYWVDVVFAPGVDSTPPVISAVTAFPMAGGTAQITWTTDRDTNSRVDYGTSPSSLALNASSSTFVRAHSVTLTGLASGVTYYYRVTSADSTGSTAVSPAPPGAPASFTENVSSVWSATTVPATPDFGDSDGIELGLKFRADAAGQILGVRFYKSAANTGTHIGNLWSSSGTLLARATFTGETASGWQNVYFSQPVQVTPNTTYVVSYYAPAGHYAAASQAFATQGVDSVPLHALANGADGPNGLYLYGSATAFPTSSFNATNYWVDVLFLANAADTTPPVISAVSASASSTSAVISWTTNEAATSRVDYGTSPTSLTSNVSDAVLATSHTLTLTGLTSGTTYYYRVTSVDSSANSSTSPPAASQPSSFSTTAAAGPVISAVTATPGANGTATITWTTNVASNSRVDYGTTTGLGTTVSNATLVTAHSVALSGLTTGTTYYYQVTSADSLGASSSGPISSFVEAAPLTVWNSSTTPGPPDSDASSVEVGMKFRSDVAGSVVGVRFHKGTGNTGTHIGHLWTSTGTSLGTVTFANETGSGWQQANFATPIPIAANTTYIVSYFAPNGHYSANTGFFTSAGVDSPPLHALRSGVDGSNGVYRYGSSSAFPDSSYNDANYWVDVAFVPGDATPPAVTAFTIPSTTATLTVPINSFTATDNVAVTGYMTTESSTPPSAAAGGWSATAPGSYTFTSGGSKTLYGWAKDAAGNVSAGRSASVVITLSDAIPPVVTTFTIPATATTLTVPITSFTATDNVSVTGYTVNESATTPSPDAAGWSVTIPSSYTFTTAGSKTLYSWAKDAAGNVSSSVSRSVIITIQSSSVEPPGWYAGDMHVHRSCGGSPEAVSSLFNGMASENLSIISLLADMGNGEVQNPTTDLPLVNGQDASISTPTRIVHWDTEWHWDPIYFQYPHQALGGHIVALGLNQASQVWEEYTYPIFAWAHQRNGIAGFAHMQYLGTGIPQSLSCCTPIEYPVEVALGAADFISEDVDSSGSGTGGMEPDNFILAYYKLLNTGFRPGFAAGTDYPCNSGRPLGGLLTYGQAGGSQPNYRNWINAIAAGRTVVSRNGHREFLALTVNGTATPGDEISLSSAGSVNVTVQWTASQSLSGTIELVSNGTVVGSVQRSASPGAPATWTTSVNFPKSGWLAARRMGSDGHQVHTAAVFVTVNNTPIRASASDAQFYVQWMDTLLTNTSPGGSWASYFQTSRAQAQARYQAARGIFQQIALEAAGNAPTPALTNISPSSGLPGTTVPVTITGTNLFGSRLNPPAGVTVSNTASTSTQITANLVIASGAATGPRSITVTTMGGTSNAVTFTVGSTTGPVLTSINPSVGVRGTSVPVTLTGTNLTGATLNLPSGITTSGTPVVSATQITATFVIASGAATGSRNITVTTAGGTSNAVTFTVNSAAPTLAGINPSAGVRGTSVPVTLTGTNLTGATLNLPSGITTSGTPVVSATQITATFVIASGAATGSRNITVTTPNGTSNAVTFTVNPATGDTTPPVISAITASPGSSSAVIAWTTNELSNSRVDYGTSSGALNSNATSPTLVTAHSLTLSGLTPGTVYYYRVTSADAASNSSTSPPAASQPLSFSTTGGGGSATSIWSATAVPGLIDDGDPDSVELGMKFRSDVNGSITGIRFYKGAANTGTHVGSLWTSTGTLLARVTFTGETASGWQQANFATPVAITANTIYVISYFAPVGHYSADQQYFAASGVDNPPLHALREGVSGSNGVYAYGSSSTFPTNTYRSSNYWVDVVFTPSSP
jgi:phosphodiesterase/alkaline phosphatase D-like protein